MPVTTKVYGAMALVWLFTACVPVEDRGMYEYDAEGNETPPVADTVVEDISLEPAESECEEIWQTEVKPYLDEKCTMCHGEALVAGAPMSLATYVESIAPSPYGLGPLYDRIFVRADEQTMPLSGGNTPEELAVLENWAAVCADEFAEPVEEEGGESTEEEGGEVAEEEGGEVAEEEGGEVAEEEGGESGEGGGTCEEMWAAEVNPYLKQKCKSCHGASPTAGAPMPLTNYEESIAPSPYGNGPLYDRIFIRADAQTMPLGGGNTEEELQMLETWSILCSAEFSEPPEEGGESSEEGGAEEGGESSEEGGAEEGGSSSEEGGVEEGGESSEEGGAEEGGEVSEEEGGESSEEGGAEEGGEVSEEEGGEVSEEEGGEVSEEGGGESSEEGGVEEGGAEEGGESSAEGGAEEGGAEEGGESSEEGGAEEGGAEEGGESVVGISYSVDVEPLLLAECAPCHFGGGGYPPPFDMTYAMENTTYMMERIDNGTMPPGGGADPALADILEQWAEDGYLP